MEDKRNEQRKKWWNAHPEKEKVSSMKRRKVGHDYKGRCIYMITIAVEGRRPLLGCLCDPDDSHRQAWLSPSDLGGIVLKHWQEIPTHYPQVRNMGIQLMPDHLHGILFVTEPMPQHLGNVVEAFKRACEKDYRKFYGMSPSRMWEMGYTDSILHHAGQLDNMFHYLKQNPQQLWVRRNNPDLFTTMHDVNVDGMVVNMMGNRFLLDYPFKAMVQCSRRLTEQQIASEVEKFLAMAQEGVVLVSACISQGEKKVMRAAHDAGARQIVLLENGFSAYWKPGGKQFDACASGRLLLVAPWPHHNERKTITREQCLQLNDLARRIANYQLPRGEDL